MADTELRPTQYTTHTAVLLHETIDALALAPDDVVVDGTVGGGGHAGAILEKLGSTGRYIGFDVDEDALERARVRIGADSRASFMSGNFRDIEKLLADKGIVHVNKLLLDLGLSSDQLEQSGRGFSFTRDEPLYMTLSSKPDEALVTAWNVVNEWSEETLADIIYGFGGETHARKIATAIGDARYRHPLETTFELANLVRSVVPRRGKTDPATKTFQAIRIAVNDELGALEAVLKTAQTLLAQQGRIAIISFHSLEDRIVKRTFRTWKDEGRGTLVTPKPITPSEDEQKRNPRSRSAKLRVFQTR